MEWVARPRFHHQYLPDIVEYEPDAFSAEEMQVLQREGYKFKAVPGGYGNMQAVVWHKTQNYVEAASDPRGEGLALPAHSKITQSIRSSVVQPSPMLSH